MSEVKKYPQNLAELDMSEQLLRDDRQRALYDEIDALYIKPISCCLVLGRLSRVMSNAPLEKLKEATVESGFDVYSRLTHKQALDLTAILIAKFENYSE